MSEAITKARAYEAVHAEQIPSHLRPGFHLSSYVGWMNDPNGFSVYGDRYHLFYQYNPYDTVWGPMHWGHARSKDLLHWEFLPAALAPDIPADKDGCFSGSAAQLPDGRQLLMYTGVSRAPGEEERNLQTQCVAVGDGVNYEKYAFNPVLDQKDLPQGASPWDFRDPKLWLEPDGTFRCVAGACLERGGCGVLRFRSTDGFHWEKDGILEENHRGYGIMWECPDYFTLNGRQVLLISAIAVENLEAPEGVLPSGNQVLCLMGQEDVQGRFCQERMQAVDCGLDFYAPQTLLAPDGRRIMIAWMQDWNGLAHRPAQSLGWFGQMTLPRELSVRDDQLIQVPIRELETLRGEPAFREQLRLSGARRLETAGDGMLDLIIQTSPVQGGGAFSLELDWGDALQVSVEFDPISSQLSLERSGCALSKDAPRSRRCRVRERKGALELRAILDRFSLELFVNGGEQVLSCVVYPPDQKPEITLRAAHVLDVYTECWPLLPR